LHKNKYAVSSSLNAKALHKTPNRGAKCAFSFNPHRSGFEVLKAEAKAPIAAIAGDVVEDGLQEAAKARSQRLSNALP
jgi:hypothetical protein